MNLKRLWDVTNKRIAYVEGPTGHECQLWVDMNTMKMYIYDMSQWIEYTQSAANDGKTYGSMWEVINSDDEMGVYDTSKPTDTFTWESGDEVSYVFKNWDGTVLKEGKVKEGTAPTPPADPTRPADADYVYTFSGWNPEVSNITKKTVYTATYTREDRLYIEINDELSDTTGEVGGQVTVYFSTVGTPGVLYSDDPDILTVVDTDTTGGEGWTNKVTYSVGGTGTTTATITVTKNGQTASDSIQITCSAAATPENAVVLNISRNEDDEYSWSSANIFQIGPGDTGTGTQSIKNPKGPDYITIEESSGTVTSAGAWANNARVTALAGDSDMMGYIHTAIDGIMSEIEGANVRDTSKGYMFFNAPYWTALNTYLTDSTTDLATLKSTFATLIGDSTPMFSGYWNQEMGAYEPIDVTASYDATNDMTTVKIFVDDSGNYTEFRHIWNGQDGYDIQLSKYDTNVGIVMKKILDCSWDARNESTKVTYKDTLEEALKGIADEINSSRGTDTTWSGVFVDSNHALTAFLRNIFRGINVEAVYMFFDEINTIHNDSGTVLSTQS